MYVYLYLNKIKQNRGVTGCGGEGRQEKGEKGKRVSQRVKKTPDGRQVGEGTRYQRERGRARVREREREREREIRENRADSWFLESNGKMVQLGFSLIRERERERERARGREGESERVRERESQTDRQSQGEKEG
jgi:hypothetical protein